MTFRGTTATPPTNQSAQIDRTTQAGNSTSVIIEVQEARLMGQPELVGLVSPTRRGLSRFSTSLTYPGIQGPSADADGIHFAAMTFSFTAILDCFFFRKWLSIKSPPTRINGNVTIRTIPKLVMTE